MKAGKQSAFINGNVTESAKTSVAVTTSGSTKRAGDEQRGFEVVLDRIGRMIRVKLWGFWEIPMAEAFSSSVVEFGEELRRTSWSALVDSRLFVAQTQRVTEIRQEAMNKLKGLGCTRIAAVTSAAVYTMQFKRIATESHVESAVFNDTQTALEWIQRK